MSDDDMANGRSGRQRATGPSPLSTALRALVLTALVLLCTEFLLGMLVNFYVEVAPDHPGAHSSSYFSGVVIGVMWAVGGSRAAFLALHATVGLTLALLSLAALAVSVMTRRRAWIISCTFGWVGVFGAGFNGASFVNYGHDFSSLLMSVGFLLALVSYGVGYAAATKT